MIGPIVREISCLINASCCHIVHGVVEKLWGGRGAGALRWGDQSGCRDVVTVAYAREMDIRIGRGLE